MDFWKGLKLAWTTIGIMVIMIFLAGVIIAVCYAVNCLLGPIATGVIWFLMVFGCIFDLVKEFQEEKEFLDKDRI